MIMALALAFAASAQAQTASNTTTFVVPFQFNVGKQVLPAGTYKVVAQDQTVRVQKNDGKGNVIALIQRTLGANHSENEVKLTFRRHGDQFYLSQVWLPDSLGRELKRPRHENTDLANNFTVIEIPALSR
jgi:hypothetical protein